ncbi:hypothetical protein O181_088531 [Austropuccinia psidii MF-1]|uniref:Uncharacterized protein n=1 Tax=Austropuccinia psidii MF-1 TaxID=1389203 RepID=A0A9Q3IRQ5_9BASI|nr:hypothetical protein [Austropuccinia psidii MF-1]
MLNQSKMSQERKQASKAHNVEKCASQKEQQKFLKVELPDNFHGMISAVRAHFLFLLKVKDKDFSSLPAPSRKEECEIAIQTSDNLQYVPKDSFNDPSTQLKYHGFQSY